ncbi:MAG: flagellar basal body rod protein FlgB [Bdellovibrionales bacterium]|nr:flagellar basal body rod protein FlgB [Bdellovibrionales bacterium]
MGGLIEKLFDKSIGGLDKALDLQWRRNEALVSNISNSETPGYRASDLTFAGELEKAWNKKGAEVKKTNTKHLDLSNDSAAHLVADYSGATKADGNNVDIDIQISKLVENSGQYETSASLVRKKLQMLREAIRLATG